MSSHATLERWSAFVTKVTQRLTEIMAEADAGFAAMLADPGLDTIAFGNAMSALDARKKDLDQKLSSTFSDQVVEALVMDPSAALHARQTLTRAMVWMEETWERYRTEKNMALIRVLWSRLEPVWSRAVVCVRCGSELTRTVFHKAESVTCRHCGTVNSVTPDPAVYAYFAAAPHLFAEATALEHRFAVEAFKRGLDERRSAGSGLSAGLREESLEELLQWESLERAYWVAYYAAQARIVPMPESEQATWVASRMRSLYEYDFNRRNVWRAYKGMT